jgi:hypothetical protein
VKQCIGPKRDFALSVDDTVLTPTNSTANRPTSWCIDEDDEEVPVFYVKRPRARPRRKILPFLQLPTELRVEIYRLCFKCYKPIDLQYVDWYDENGCENGSSGLRQATGEKVSTALLRTCKLIHGEGEEVLFGENRLRFGRMYEHVYICEQLPQHNFQWLQVLTMSVPFPDERYSIHIYRLTLRGPYKLPLITDTSNPSQRLHICYLTFYP